jgi:hypothetical protein
MVYLATFLWLALVIVDNCDSRESVLLSGLRFFTHGALLRVNDTRQLNLP